MLRGMENTAKTYPIGFAMPEKKRTDGVTISKGKEMEDKIKILSFFVWSEYQGKRVDFHVLLLLL